MTKPAQPLLFLLTSALTTCAAAQMPEYAGVPPQFAIVSKVDRDAHEILLSCTVSKPVHETRTVTVEVDGKLEQRQQTVTRLVTESRMQIVKLADVRVVTAGKEKLDTEAALERLRTDSAVLLYDQGTKIDARYVAALRPETLILIVKPVEPPPAPVVRPGKSAP